MSFACANVCFALAKMRFAWTNGYFAPTKIGLA